MAKTPAKLICKNVFKSGADTTVKEQYTRCWIKLINELEQNKTVHAKHP